jgi:hypothetical protein
MLKYYVETEPIASYTDCSMTFQCRKQSQNASSHNTQRIWLILTIKCRKNPFQIQQQTTQMLTGLRSGMPQSLTEKAPPQVSLLVARLVAVTSDRVRL